MAGGGGPIPKNTFKIVRYISLSNDDMKKIAQILKITSKEEQDALYSGTIHIVPNEIQQNWPKHNSKKKR